MSERTARELYLRVFEEVFQLVMGAEELCGYKQAALNRYNAR